MSLEIRFKQDSNSSPQYLSLKDGESLQVFSGESFQIQNPQIVAQLVPQANDLQIVCHDGSSYILKSFLDVQFSQEPTLELKEGTSITWHDFVQQSDSVERSDIADEQYSQSLLFAPLHVIAMTSESQKWDLSQFPPEGDGPADESGIVSNDSSHDSANKEEKSQEGTGYKPAPVPEDPLSETKFEGEIPEGTAPGKTESDKGDPLHYTTSTSLNEIEIDVREFIPQLHKNNLTHDLTISANMVGDDPTQIVVDPGTGILRLPQNVFEDNPQKKFIISIRDKGVETGTAITITQTKDGGGEAFHLILSHNRVTENNEGAFIGKLDTDDSGQGHNYEYSILNDESGVFEIVGNVLKLKDGVSIDYETQPDRYPITIASIDENGNRIEQTMSVWPEDVNEAASVSSVGVNSLEDVTVTFNPEDFEDSFEDEDSDYLEMIRIDSLPDNGVLLLEGERVTNGQLIDIDQVEDLEFHPDVNWNGDTEFTWSGFDGQKWSGESSPVNITIEAVNDAPVVNVNVGSETTATDTPFELALPENAFTDADTGDTLTYSADLPSWLEIDPETGSLRGKPDSESVGDHTVTITATDSSGESASQSFVITVDQPNRAPTMTQIEDQSVDEDSLFNLDVSDNFTDLDGDALTYSATLENGDPLPDWLSFDSENGTLSGTPKNEDVGDLNFSIAASDGEETVSQNFSLSVENTNEIPVLRNLTAASPEDTIVRLSTEVLETAFEDPDGDPIDAIRIDSLPEGGTLMLGDSPIELSQSIGRDQIGDISFQPDENWTGQAKVLWSASDGSAWSQQPSALTIDVQPVNDGPTVTNEINDAFTDEDASFSLNISGNFTDADFGDRLSFSATLENGDPLPGWMTIDSETGEVSGLPRNSDVGQFFITVTASDGEATASDTFELTVANTNDGPTVSTNITNKNTLEDELFSIDTSANFSDQDVGDTLSYSATLQNGEPLPDWLSIDPETGVISGTPENPDVGKISISVTASDGNLSGTDSFDLTVFNTNDAPLVNWLNENQAIEEDSTFSLDASEIFTDIDVGDALTYSATLENGDPLPDWLQINPTTGELSGTPENEDVGEVSLTLSASDGEATTSKTFSLQIENTNDGPVVTTNIEDQTIDEDAAFELDVSVNFADEDLGEPLTYSATLENGDPLPNWIRIDSETGQIAGTPRNSDVGNVTIKVTASDGMAQASDSFELAVENGNDGPFVTSTIADQTIDEDHSFSLDVSENFSDNDLGDVLTYSATLENGDPLPEWLSIDSDTGLITGTPENADVGDSSITITASDGEAQVSDSFDLIVENTNDGPKVSTSIGDKNTREDTSFTLDVSEHFEDEDSGDSLTFSATLENGDPLPDWISIDPESGELTGSPKNSDAGDIEIKITASDGESEVDQSFNLSVGNNNDAPTLKAAIEDTSANEDNLFTLDVSQNFDDIDISDELVFEATLENGDPLPEWLAFDENTGMFSGQPTNDDVGDLSITVLASDGESIASDTFSVSVQNTNDGPTATAVSDQTTDEDAAFSLDVSGNFDDEDLGDTLTFSATLESGDPLPDWVSFDSDTGQFSGTPDNGDAGSISVTVTATDQSGAAAASTFGIQVDNTNDGPTATAVSDQTTDEDAAFSLDVSGNFDDEDLGDTLTFSATLESGDPLPDWVSFDSDTGQFSGTPDNGDAGSISVTVTATDQSGAAAASTFGIQVDNTNDGPTATAVSDQTTDEDAAFSLDVSGNFDDEDLGDTLTFSATLESGDPLPDWVSFDSDTGQFSGTPDNGDAGSISVTVTATDQSGAAAASTFGIQVDNTNDGPTATAVSDQTTDEDAAFSLDVSGNFDDEDLGDTLTFSATLESGDPLPDWVSFDSDTGQFSGTPDNGDAGSISVTVTATDQSGAAAASTFGIQVDNTNDGPTATAVSDQTTDEDAAFSLDVSGNFDDEDLGDTLTFSATLENGDPLPDWVSFDSDTGQFSGTPDNGDAGSISVTVTASDGEASASDTFSITVENTNDGPTVTTQTQETLWQEDFDGMADGTRSDDGSSAWTTDDSAASMTPIHGVSNEAYEFSQSANMNYDDESVVKLETESIDIAGKTDLELTFDFMTQGDMESSGSMYDFFEVVATVDGVEHEIHQQDGNHTDGNDTFHTISLSELPEGESLVLSFVGKTTTTSESFKLDNIRLNGDSVGLSDKTVDEDSSFNYDVSTSFDDIDVGDTLTYSATLENGDPLPDWLSLDPNTGQFSGTPENGDVGELSIEVIASDGEAAVSETFSISIENTNDGPTVVAQIADQTIDEDSVFSLDTSSSFSDEDLGDTLAFSATLENGDPLPDWLSIDENTGELSGTPENGDVGNLSVKVTASDSETTVSDTFSVTVENTNDGPTVIDGGLSSVFEPENATLVGEINFDSGVPSATYGSIASEESGMVGDAADFSNAKLSVDAMDLPDGAAEQTTVSMWVQANPSGSWEMLVASRQYDLVLKDGNIGFNTGQSDLFGTDASELSDGQWHHVVATFTNGDVSQNAISIDGIEQDMSQIQGTPSSTHANIDTDGGTLHFGGWGVNNGYYFTGSMDEVKVFDGTLNQDEIGQLFDIESSHTHWENAGLSATEDAAFSLDTSAAFADEDVGDELTFSATLENGDPLPDWLSIDPDSGLLSGTPENGDVGELSLTVTASDGEASASDTFSLTVENTNDGPIVSTSISDQTTDEDAAFSLDVSGNFADEDIGDELTFSATLENGDPLPDWLSIDPDTGELSGTPDNGDVGDISVTVTASDGEAAASDTFSLTVENTNDGPTITSASGQNLWAEDFEGVADGATSDGGDSAWATDSSAATVSPIHGVSGEAYEFSQTTTTAGDDGALLKLQTEAIDISGKSNLDLTFDLKTEGGMEESGDFFDYFQVVAIVDGVPVEIHQQDGNHVGGNNIFHSISLDDLPEGDSLVLSFEAKTTTTSEVFTLDNIRLDGDVVGLANQTATEDSSFTLDISANFADEDVGDSLSFTATLENGDPLPTWLSFDTSTGVFSGTPDNGDVGNIAVTVAASDGEASTSDTFTLMVENTNDGPTVSTSIADTTTDEDAAFSLDVSGNFADEDMGDTLTFSATLENGDPLPDWLSIDADTGELSGTPENGDVGDISVTVTASDGEASASDTFEVTVENTNDGPTVVSGGLSSSFAPQDATLINEINFNSGIPTASQGSLSSEASGMVGDAADFSNAQLSVDGMDLPDGAGEQTTVSMWIQGNPSGSWEMLVASDRHDLVMLNGNIGFNTSQGDVFGADASELSDGQWHHVVATFTNGDVTQNSIHIDGVAQSLSQLQGTPSSAHANIDSDGGTLHFGGWGYGNGYTFTGSMDEIKVFGGTLTQDEIGQLFDIESSHSHWENAGVSATEDAAFSLDTAAAFADEDVGDTLTFSATLENGDPLPDWLSFNSVTGELSGTPDNGDVGDISVTVTASDGEASASDTFSLTVENTNDGPTVSTSIADQTTDEDAAFSLDVSGNFADEDIGDELTFSATLENGDPLPDWLSIDSETGELSGTPENGDVGDISVTVTASDGEAAASDTFSITVENTNDGPVATADTANVTEPNTVTIDVIANDTDDEGDALTITSATLPSGDGSVSIVDNKLVFDPGDDFPDLAKDDTETVEITYTISDGNGGESTSTVSVTVTGDDSLIAGSESSQTVTGTDNSNTIDGGAGNDTIYGEGGDDTIIGGEGNDNLYGGDGDDTFEVSAGDGWDKFDGGAGDDTIVSTDGSDIQLDSHLNTADSIENISAGGHAGVKIQGDGSSQTIDLSGTTLDGIDTIDGGAGHDTIVGSGADDTIIGGEGNDNLYGGGGDDTFEVSSGDGWDNFDGGDGDDTVVSTDGVDIQIDGHLTTSDSIENISAGGHADVKIQGDGSSQTIDLSGTTLDGIDTVDGGAGHDTIIGSEAADTIIGGEGNDNLYGGGGDDTFEVSSGDGWDNFDGGDGDDTVVSTDGVDIQIDGHLTTADSIENISAGGHAGVKIQGDGSSQTIDLSGTTLDGIDTIDGGAGHDTIVGSGADDTIIGGEGNDNLYGGGGDDTFEVSSGDGWDNFDGGDGDDTVVSTDGVDIQIDGHLTTSDSIENISAGGHAGVKIQGDGSSQTIDLSGTTLDGIDTIDGGAGHDTIVGSGADDTIIGGTGNDNLYGGAGDDTFLVSEGDGADDFHGGDGTDTVKATGDNVDITIDGHFSSTNSIENISADGYSNVTVSGDSSSQTLDFSGTNLDGISAIDGGAGHDTITGTGSDDNIIGGSGNDTINAGAGNDTIDATEGSDNVDAGSGDDTITVGDNFLSGGDVDGGEGEDALVFDGADLFIDLSSLDAGALQNIEHINIDGSGSNNLRLSAEDVLDVTDGDNRLFIDGGSDDSVEISADYSNQGTETIGGVDYSHYYDVGTDSHLYINNDITDLNTF